MGERVEVRERHWEWARRIAEERGWTVEEVLQVALENGLREMREQVS